MAERGALTEDVEAHYRTLLYDLDLVAYNNCNYDGEPVPFRKSLLSMARALASVATIDASRTREASYNLSQIAKAVDHPLLTKKRDRFNSDNLRVVHQALACGLYRLVSGCSIWDAKQREYCERIVRIMDANRVSAQQLEAVDTITGSFDLTVNLQALLALRLHDLQHGTDWSARADEVIDGLEAVLLDEETGLFFDSFHTGSLGFLREELSTTAFWPLRVTTAGPSALAIALYHYFRPTEAEQMWGTYKVRFGEQLLSVTAEDMRGNVGHSYLTELGGASEALLSAMECAREMEDETFFAQIHAVFARCTALRHVEARLVYDGLEETEGPLHVYAALAAQVHRPWRFLLEEYPWAEHYGQDFDRVR